MSRPSALITGASGFIGSHLTERLLALDWQVSTVTRSLADKPAEIGRILSGSNCYQGDLIELLAAGKLDQDFDYVFHLAGTASVPNSIESPTDDLHQNAGITLALLENLRHRQHKSKLLYVSSAAVYGNPERMPIQEIDPVAPISPYAVSKLAAESYVRVYCEIFGLPTAVLRPFSVYGPRQTKLVIYDLLKQLENSGKTLNIRGDGTQARDFVHVSDVVNAFLMVATNAPFKGESYNVASGTSVSVKDLVSLLIETTGQKRQIIYSDQINAGEPLRWQVDIARLRALGFSPQTSLREGLHSLSSSFALPQAGEASCLT